MMVSVAAQRYHLEEPATVDLDDGRVVASFKAGDVSAKGDVELEALEHLVENGLARRLRSAKEDT